MYRPNLKKLFLLYFYAIFSRFSRLAISKTKQFTYQFGYKSALNKISDHPFYWVARKPRHYALMVVFLLNGLLLSIMFSGVAFADTAPQPEWDGTGDGSDALFFQTTGGIDSCNDGNWLTCGNGLNGDHFYEVTMPCDWPVGVPFHIDIFSPWYTYGDDSSGGSCNQVNAPNSVCNIDESGPGNNNDDADAISTQFILFDVGSEVNVFSTPQFTSTGTVVNTIYPPQDDQTDHEWVRFHTMTPTTAVEVSQMCGTYTIYEPVAWTSSARNGFALRTGTDNDNDPTNTPPPDYANPGGLTKGTPIEGIGWEPEFGGPRDSSTDGTLCSTYYYSSSVSIEQPTVSFYWFDLDFTSFMTVTAPDGTVYPNIDIENGSGWNSNGVNENDDAETTDPATVAAAVWDGVSDKPIIGDHFINPTDGGIWQVDACISSEDHHYFSGPLGDPILTEAPPGTITGTVTFDTNADGVGDNPIENVNLILLDENGAPVLDLAGNQITTTTNADGEYVFLDVAPGDYFVGQVQPEGFDSVSDQDSSNDGDSGDTNTDVDNLIPVTVGLNETDGGNDFVEVATATIGNTVWLDENGDGIQDAGEDGIGNAVVTLTPPADVDLGNGVGQPITTTTDANGGYLFTDLPPGDYDVAVDTSSLPSGLGSNATYDEDSGTASPDNTTSVTLEAGEEHQTADFGYNWAPPTDTENPPSNATGAIGDYIWIDADGDGQQDPGEAGIPNVTVILTASDGTTTTVMTDESGHYIFDGLAADAYTVSVDPSTLPAGYTQTGDPDDFGSAASSPDNTTTTPIVLGPGDVFVNADFGYQPASGSDIGDTIYFDADGDGVEDAGEPGIAGVTVALLDADGNVIATTTTDENGEYLFPSLPAGDYQVVVTDTDNVLGELDPSGNPDGGTPDNQGAVITHDGATDNLDQDFGYAPPTHDSGDGLIGDTIYLDIDGGGSQGADEPGLEGVTVTLTDENGNTLTTTTDENGNYSFGNLDPAGTYTVTVDSSTLPSGLFPSEDPDGGDDFSSTIELSADPDGTNDGVNLGQDFGFTADNPATVGEDESNSLSGTIWEDVNADGTLTTTETTGLSGVTVNLYGDPDGDGVYDTLIGTTTTDGSGNYSFDGLPDGQYVVDVTDEANELAGYWHSDGPNDGSDDNSQTDTYLVDLDSEGNSDAGVTDPTADFGYYVEPGAIGNIVFEDSNGDGDQDIAETGISGVPVTLTITYPNGDIVTLATTTSDGTTDVDGDGIVDPIGSYHFGNLLLDEDYNGEAGSPTYSVSVGEVEGFTSTYDGTPDATGVGNGTDTNADNPDGEAAFPAQGTTDNTNDFGFEEDPTYSISNLVWLEDSTPDSVYNGADTGINGVTVELWDGPPNQPGSNMITSTQTMNGEYQFDGLTADTYYVHIPSSNFNAGGPLYDSSSGTSYDVSTQYSGVLTDNVMIGIGDATNGVSSGAIVITNDDDSTVDFGFFIPSSTAVSLSTIQVDAQQTAKVFAIVSALLGITILVTYKSSRSERNLR